MPRALRLETRLPPHFAEPPIALVEEEQVANGGDVRRETRERTGHRLVRVGVARDEDVRATVAVDVGDRGAGVPAGVRERLLPEGSAARVPEDLRAARRRDDEVRPVVAVQIGRDAPVALHREIGVRRVADVAEPAVRVLEERRPREAAVRVPLRRVGARVRVDGEEVEPAVVVVVEPADSSAHHRAVVR